MKKLMLAAIFSFSSLYLFAAENSSNTIDFTVHTMLLRQISQASKGEISAQTLNGMARDEALSLDEINLLHWGLEELNRVTGNKAINAVRTVQENLTMFLRERKHKEIVAVKDWHIIWRRKCLAEVRKALRDIDTVLNNYVPLETATIEN